MLRKTADTWDCVARAFVTATQSQIHASGPHLMFGCQQLSLVRIVRERFHGRIMLAKPPFEGAKENVGLIVGDSPHWQEKVKQAMSCDWWRLCMLLPVTCVHEVIAGVHEFSVQSIGAWCWCYTDARFHVDESEMDDMSLPHVLRAILDRVDMVCKTEQSRRMENLSVGPHSPHEVCAAWEDVVVDVERWRPLLDEAEQVFLARPSAASWDPDTASTFFQKFQQLVPWKIEKMHC
eukprot:5867125-Amphidinium_carterae.1